MLNMVSEHEFINCNIPLGSYIPLVWLNLPVIETHLTKIVGCFVDFTSEIRAFVMLLSLIAGNWQYGVGMYTNVVTSKVH
jgi:hypothetical protein